MNLFTTAEAPLVSDAPGPATDRIAISVLVLVTYKPESLVEVYRDYASAIRKETEDFEFLFLVEPAFADQTSGLHRLAECGEPVRVLQVGQAMGETSLLRVGTRYSRGSILITTPAYRQVDSRVMRGLIQAIDGGYDLAVARRWPRKDSWFKQAHTRIFRAVASRVAGTPDHVRDVTCGVRAMRRELVNEIPLYGDLGLFLPVLALRDGYRVTEVQAPQHEADQRTKVYHPLIYLRRLFDVLGLFFLLRFTEKPLRFFGAVGAAALIPGAVILLTVLFQRLGGQAIADRPLLLLGVLLVVLGIQAIALGLIGEIIVHLHASRPETYRVDHSSDRL